MSTRNVDVKVTGDKATITINLKEKGVPSASGKNMIIASTGGAVEIPGTEVKLNFNAYRKA